MEAVAARSIRSSDALASSPPRLVDPRGGPLEFFEAPKSLLARPLERRRVFLREAHGRAEIGIVRLGHTPELVRAYHAGFADAELRVRVYRGLQAAVGPVELLGPVREFAEEGYIAVPVADIQDGDREVLAAVLDFDLVAQCLLGGPGDVPIEYQPQKTRHDYGNEQAPDGQRGDAPGLGEDVPQMAHLTILPWILPKMAPSAHR